MDPHLAKYTVPRGANCHLQHIWGEQYQEQAAAAAPDQPRFWAEGLLRSPVIPCKPLFNGKDLARQQQQQQQRSLLFQAQGGTKVSTRARRLASHPAGHADRDRLASKGARQHRQDTLAGLPGGMHPIIQRMLT
eukprot:scaffold26270_cov17-Tisochrysis_lutea.AAC.3